MLLHSSELLFGMLPVVGSKLLKQYFNLMLLFIPERL
jgi:hypothetical protein